MRGEDVKYYGSRVEQFTGRTCDNIVSYNCGGKVGVLKVKDMIKPKKQYDHVKIAYFIDCDFYPQKGLEENVYQTTGYSVENYYTSSEAFKRILKYAFGINCNSSDYTKCMNDYNKSMDEFHRQVLILNAWIKAHRQNELKTGKRELEMNNFKIAQFFQTLAIDNVVVKQKIDKELLEGKFPELCVIENVEIEKYVSEFKQTDLQQTLRGKFEMEFLKKIIDDLKNKHKKGVYFNEEYECIKIDPNVDSLFTLSQCADTPESLIIFLKQFRVDNVV